MSVLDFPRIHFSGICSLHEPTGNNNFSGNIDLTKNQIYDEKGRLIDFNTNPEEFYKYFTSIGDRFDTDGKLSKEGNFNPTAGRDYEGNSRVLWDAKVTSYQLSPQETITQGVLIGESVSLWGHYNEYLQTSFNQPKVVKLDPTDASTRQIFGGQFTVGERLTDISSGYYINGNINQVQHARWNKTMHYKDLPEHWNNDEIGRAAVYQFVISEKDIIELDEQSNATCTHLFKEILKNKQEAQGIVVQFTLCNASNPVAPDTPAFYSLYGTIGIWNPSTEMATYPAGRVFVPNYKNLQNQWCKNLGMLSAKIKKDHVSLNAIIGFPFSKRSLHAINGPLHEVGVVCIEENLNLFSKGLDKPIIKLTKESFSTPDFLVSCGVLDIPICNEFTDEEWHHIEQNDLYFAVESSQGTSDLVLMEQSIIIQADQASIYLEIPSEKNNLFFDESIEIRSFKRGKPCSIEEIQIVQQYNPFFHPFNNSDFLLDTIKKASISVATEDDHTIFSDQIVFSTDIDGKATITLRGISSGSLRVFFIHNDQEKEKISNLLKKDDFEAYTIESLQSIYPDSNMLHAVVMNDDWHLFNKDPGSMSFDFMYKEVLSFYELLFPFMNREVFSLANKPKTKTYARLSWQMCDPMNKSKSYYMPPTRDLSYPKALLFKEFLTHVSAIGYVPKKETR
ncbi:hypothetical protein [Aquimarina sp. RZ0]|uniref:hypothetical protein n=1 Tax=Aquimarina sp. RZ0 TaxID=2607730 RepID=UPI0011F1CC88|nr:hypothetical protein [Aquimarina sp. RZ0]KAA1247025.1 hypothetical protein F0000_04895 [Aquimarina sp. RZ0]